MIIGLHQKPPLKASLLSKIYAQGCGGILSRALSLPMLLWLVAVLSVGCVPIQRIDWKTSQDEIRISPDRSALSVSVRTSTPDPDRKPGIDTNLSFAVSPSGKRLNISIEQNDYANEWARTNPTPWISSDVHLIDPSNKKDVLWNNGNWKLDLNFQGPVTRPPIHSEFRLYTFWYCPLFMRPF